MAETAHTSWYRTGTVSITSGSTEVNGVSTRWLTADIKPGASFRIDGLPDTYEVAEVVSDIKLTLMRPYYGVNLSGKSYSIDRNFQSTLPSDLASDVADLLGKYEEYIDTDMHTVQGESAYDIARRLGKTTAATESAWIDELKNGEEYVALKETVAALTADEAGNHNAQFYDKNAGLFTDAISAAIRNGTFTGIYPGMYFDFANVPYTYVDENDEEQSSTYSGRMRILDLDYFLRCGDSDLTAHHVVVAPDTNMYTAPMNATHTTDGGYVGSKMRTVYLKRAEAIFKACFGESHILKHRMLLTTTVVNGKPTAVAWCDSYVDLMNELMVYGSYVFAPANDGVTIPYRYTESKSQLAAFRHKHSLITIHNQWWWLRDVVSAACFASVDAAGICGCHVAGPSGGGVRPAALIY